MAHGVNVILYDMNSQFLLSLMSTMSFIWRLQFATDVPHVHVFMYAGGRLMAHACVIE